MTLLFDLIRETPQIAAVKRSYLIVKVPKVIFAAAVAMIVCSPLPASAAHPAKGAPASNTAASRYLGRWDLTLRAPDHEWPSWLEISEEGGQLKARMTGRWGNARPLPKVDISDGKLTFVSPKEEEDSKADMVFEGKLTGKTLTGTVNGPDGSTWNWVGNRAPALVYTRTPQWGKPVSLFNGKDLTGWHPDKPGAPEWTVQNGTIVSPGHGHELINDQKFQDFKLHLEFNCGKDANSGVYLRGRYEVQIETESQAEPPSHHTGGVYGFLAPDPELPRRADVWQTYDITLIGRKVTIVQNGTTVINDKEIPGPTGGALDSHEAMPGPIYLQGSEKGHVAFRNIVVTPAL
jgi:3-keto-disaccharide hydrolase